jgi:hypothetical protein
MDKGAEFLSGRGKSYELGPRITLILVSNTINYIMFD